MLAEVIDQLSKLAELSDGQWGLVTEDQASAVGVSRRYLNSIREAGLIEWIVPGMFRMRFGGHHPFPRQFARWLLLDPSTPSQDRSLPESGVLTGATALRIHKVIDLPDDTTETVAPDPQLLRSVPGVSVHAGALGEGDWLLVSDLPVASPDFAFVDLVISGRLDPVDLGRIAATLLRKGLADEDQLAGRLDKASTTVRGAGRQWLPDLLDAHDKGE